MSTEDGLFKLLDRLDSAGCPQQPRVYSCVLPFEVTKGAQGCGPARKKRPGGATPRAKNGPKAG